MINYDTKVLYLDRVFAQNGLFVLFDFNYHCNIFSSYFIGRSRIAFLFFQSPVNKVITTTIKIITIIIIMIIYD